MKAIKLLGFILLTFIVIYLFINKVFSYDLVITNAQIINIEKGVVEPLQDIYIRDGKILKVADANAKLKFSKSNNVVDANGGYVLPGFIESHAHVAIGPVKLEFEDSKPYLAIELMDEIPELTLKLLLANGVTTARDPGGLTEVTVKAKNDVLSGKIIGPNLFVAGSILDTLRFKNLTTQVKTNDEIRAEIERQKASGVDFVKLYTSLSPEQLRTGIDHTRKLGLKSISHLHTTSWTEAANLKLDNIVHIIPGNEKLLPQEKRDEYMKFANLGAIAFYKWFEYVDLDSPEIKEMIDALKRNGVSVDPTLVPFHSAFFGDTGKYQNQEELNYLPEALLKNWKTTFNFNLGWRTEDFEIAHTVWPKVEKLVKMLHENGILLTAGTDANNPYMIPGFSYHQELGLLKQCGLSNQEVLEIAILNGAKLLGLENSIGKIEKGYQANIVLLDKNPLEKIENTKSLKLIIKEGKVYSKNELLESID